jgi:hypothetical protein
MLTIIILYRVVEISIFQKRFFQKYSTVLMMNNWVAEEHVRNELKENLNMLGLQYNLQSFLEVISTWCQKSGFSCRYE